MNPNKPVTSLSTGIAAVIHKAANSIITIPYNTVHRTSSSFLQIIIGSWLIAVCSWISLPLFFTPVPLTGQTFGVMVIGVVLGSKKGALSVLLYLLQGILGLPVWAGASCGPFHLLGPTGGYFIGFILQACIAGILNRQTTYAYSFFKKLFVLIAACSLQLLIGASWLAFLYTTQYAWTMGVIPFVFGEVIKSILVTLYAQKTQPAEYPHL